MTTITIPRTLLEQAIGERDIPIRQTEHAILALRAELAKPVQKEPITLEQFRAIAHCTATTYRHRSDPEKSSYAFVDGSSLDDFWRKVCEAIQPTPAWHDAPEMAALKAECDALKKDAERYRWLAANARSTSEHWGGRWSLVIDGPAPKRHDCEDALDEAIDAAIAKEGTP